MNAIADFLTIIQDELGLDIAREDIDKQLDEVAGWESVQLLMLLSALERETGRAISLPDVLAATSLAEIYAIVTGHDG
jgi:acyl carrier protein